MSDSRDQSQPSMEEILASIRKIIAEDDPKEDPRAAAGALRGAAVAAGRPQPAQREEPARPSAAADDDEILNLTRMVGEDGSVVDLDNETPSPAAPRKTAAEGPARDENAAATGPAPRGRGRTTAGSGTAAEGQAPAADQTKASGTKASAPAPKQQKDEAMPRDDGIASMEGRGEAPRRPRSAAALLSDDTSAAASAALSEIARTVRRNRAFEEEPMVTGDRSLEALVRDALAPHLKVWLDENLEPIVERVVRDEVRRLARRVEDE